LTDILARQLNDVDSPAHRFPEHTHALGALAPFLDASLHPIPRPVFSINQGSRSACPVRRPVSLLSIPRGTYSRLQKGGDPAAGSPTATLLRLRPSHRARLRRLPPLRVGSPTSGAPDSHGVTGGVYKARERIHRGVADPRLLAIPASCSRVTDCNPNLDQVFAIRSASRPRCALSWPL
jgi:hypothetical protein